MKIGSAINNALMLSLRGADGKLLAIACLTRQSAQPYSERHLELVQWASALLADSVSKTLSEAIVRRKATLDGLTKIANRRTFDERIAQELFLAKSNQKTCSLVLIDLDHFKQINDRHGHQVGDAVLQETADILKRITSQTRTSDPVLVARYGGEMAILLQCTNSRGGTRI
ncbi:MAG: GGDEF domain-containing protein [Planctomycetaceae bacterium]